MTFFTNVREEFGGRFSLNGKLLHLKSGLEFIVFIPEIFSNQKSSGMGQPNVESG